MIAILDCGSSKVPAIERAVDEFMDFKTFPLLDFDPKQHDEFIGIIISGAPLLITEMDMSPYMEKSIWLKEIEIPVLGICFGHQLLGLNYGAFGSLIREDRDWQEIEFTDSDPIINRMPHVTEMMEDHCEAISIPPNFKLLASSDACVNEAMKHNQKDLYGVQFHPEVSGNMGRVLIENFIRICEKKLNGHSSVER
ncbi:MAG: glutamine amidotransferase-related protein [Bacteroidota bacterium]